MFSLIEVSGTLALITSFIGLIPQIYKVYQTKSAQDLSFIMLINYLVCSLAWILYASQGEADVVIYSNILGLITSLISIGQKIYYDKFFTGRETNH
jgi:MtN3 and saliva related transmembrane protein